MDWRHVRATRETARTAFAVPIFTCNPASFVFAAIPSRNGGLQKGSPILAQASWRSSSISADAVGLPVPCRLPGDTASLTAFHLNFMHFTTQLVSSPNRCCQQCGAGQLM